MTNLANGTAERIESTGIVRAQTPALIVAIIGVIGCAIGWIINPTEFYRSYLPSYIFWFEIAVGSLGILMIQYVTGGEWGLLIRRPMGAAARTSILLLVLFVPIFIGAGQIYSWANPQMVAHDVLLQQKQGYLGYWFWFGRAIFYFALWIWWSWHIRSLSLKFYETRAPEVDLRRRAWAGSGLPMMVLSLTFCSIDWLMSLEPKWYSLMYGITFLVGAGLSAYAFTILLLTQLSKSKAMAEIVTPMHFRDLGNLMLTFVIFWAYVAFSQFLLIWYGNIKEEIPYYLKREHGVWGVMAASLVLFHFFLPFFMLLMRSIKDNPRTIAIVAVLILVMRYVHNYWLIGPAFYGEHFYFSWMSIAAFLAVGGIWFWFFVQQIKGQTIIPIHETWVEEAVREGRLTTNV